MPVSCILQYIYIYSCSFFLCVVCVCWLSMFFFHSTQASLSGDARPILHTEGFAVSAACKRYWWDKVYLHFWPEDPGYFLLCRRYALICYKSVSLGLTVRVWQCCNFDWIWGFYPACMKQYKHTKMFEAFWLATWESKTLQDPWVFAKSGPSHGADLHPFESNGGWWRDSTGGKRKHQWQVIAGHEGLWGHLPRLERSWNSEGLFAAFAASCELCGSLINFPGYFRYVLVGKGSTFKVPDSL